MTDLTILAGRLADVLAAEGHLSDPHWRNAFAAVPRHLLVPCFLRDDNTVVDSANPVDYDEWLVTVYSDTSLTTQTRRVPGTDLSWPTSSSTRPSLMAHMLGLLDVAEGHRVLEIGTGTGYNAAVLCHRLGDTNIASIDIHPDLITDTRDRLARIGYRPHLVSGDGAAGVPEHAPYDRIIATCAIPTVPAAWIDQLTPTGIIVADVRGELSSSLAVLHKIDDRTVEGRFSPIPGHFMWLRSDADNPLRTAGTLVSTIDHDNAVQTVTDLDPALLEVADLRFLLQHRHAIEQVWSSERGSTDIVHLYASDGSWAEVEAMAGRHTITQGGPRPIGSLAEECVVLWTRLGRPTRDRFGITATSDGAQRLWLDTSDSGLTWPLTKVVGQTVG